MTRSETGGAPAVVYGDTGGVGETTCRAARALALARDVLPVSTDPAHPPGDALGTDLGPEPTAVTDDSSGSRGGAGRRWRDGRGVVHGHRRWRSRRPRPTGATAGGVRLRRWRRGGSGSVSTRALADGTERASALTTRNPSTSVSYAYQPASSDSTNPMACSMSGVERYRFVSCFNSRRVRSATSADNAP